MGATDAKDAICHITFTHLIPGSMLSENNPPLANALNHLLQKIPMEERLDAYYPLVTHELLASPYFCWLYFKNAQKLDKHLSRVSNCNQPTTRAQLQRCLMNQPFQCAI